MEDAVRIARQRCAKPCGGSHRGWRWWPSLARVSLEAVGLKAGVWGNYVVGRIHGVGDRVNSGVTWKGMVCGWSVRFVDPNGGQVDVVGRRSWRGSVGETVWLSTGVVRGRPRDSDCRLRGERVGETVVVAIQWAGKGIDTCSSRFSES